MGSWQMARHGHTQMPTSYLSHLCQDKTHEAGMESSSWGNKMWEMREGETYSFTWPGNFEKKKKCLIIKNSIFCVAWFFISCVEHTFGVEIIYTSLCTIHPIPWPAIHPSCYLWNKKLSYFDRYVKLLAVLQGLQCVERSKDSWGKIIFSGLWSGRQ